MLYQWLHKSRNFKGFANIKSVKQLTIETNNF